MAAGQREALPPIRIVNRHRVRVPQGDGGGLGGGLTRRVPGTRETSPRSSSPSPRSTAAHGTRSSPRRTELSPLGKFRAGVFTLEATKAFADSTLAGGRPNNGSNGNFGGAAGGGGGGGGGGSGPTVGSPQESSLIVQRQVGSGACKTYFENICRFKVRTAQKIALGSRAAL